MAIPGKLGFAELKEIKEKEFLELIGMLVNLGVGLLGLAGLFGVAFGRKLLTRGFWRVFAWIFGLDLVLRAVWGGVEVPQMENLQQLAPEYLVFAFFIGLPFLFISVVWVVAIFSYARDPIWND